MISPVRPTVGVLLSGGLDSCILVARLLDEGHRVQPFYVRTDLCWQPEELRAVGGFLAAIARPTLNELVLMDMPLRDLYRNHWSVSGHDSPDADSPDEAVFLPGRNALLLVKAAIWCQLHGIEYLALAPLGTSPFADAQPAFFRDFQAALNCGDLKPLTILRPFDGMSKQQVMELGRSFPLELSFSCIAPLGGLHCGRCNKCAERQAAFAAIGESDRTAYSSEIRSHRSEVRNQRSGVDATQLTSDF
jgi:7-cyano-7-deazaguanine synthase